MGGLEGFTQEVLSHPALMYRWFVFALLIFGLGLLKKHGILTPFVLWSRIQYYTFFGFGAFFFWFTATLFKVDVPYLYTADCRYLVAASLGTLSVMYHLIVRPGAIRTHKLNDINYEHFSFYNYVFHYFIPMLMFVDYIFFVDKTEMHWENIFIWMWFPALYVVFVYFRAWLTVVLHGKSNLYPYTFMDPTVHSVLTISKGVLKVGFQFWVIGVIIYAVGLGLFELGIPPISWTYNY